MRSARVVVVAAGVVSLSLVVAATVSLPGPTGTGRFVPRETLREGVGSLVRLAAIGFFFVMLYDVMAGLGGRLKETRFGQGGASRRLPLAILVLLLVGAAVLVGRQRLRLSSGAESGEIAGENGFVMPSPIGSPEGESTVSLLPGPGWPLWTIALVGLAATGYLVYRARGQRGAVTRSARDNAAASEPPQLVSARPDYAGPTDPAGRVVAAYVGVESAAELAGMPRADGETIRRHLVRVGARTDVVSAHSLASVYEAARYSPFEIDENQAELAESAGSALTEQFM
ncbi:hypothetical protein BH23ACT5_BH23ACT5_21830 [soil metagenome]